MPIISINNSEDERIAPFLGVRERDIIGRDHHFIAEGRVVIQLLLKSSYTTEALLICEKQRSFLEHIPAQILETTPIYIASQDIMNSIVGFPIHRGLLALGRKPLSPSPNQFLNSLAEPKLVIGIIGLTNHDNMGGIFRNAASFGCSAILLDQTCCDPFYRKALRVSVGGVLKVPFIQTGDSANLIDILEQNQYQIFALSPAGTTLLSDIPNSGRNALLLGSEGPGLPKSVMERVTTVRIPMTANFDSLNVATTSGIALYEMTKP